MTVATSDYRPLKASLFQYLHGCPICFSRDSGHYSRVPSLFDEGAAIVYERCRTCGVVFRNPRLPPSERLAIYENKILPESQKRLIPKNQVHYAQILREINRLFPRGSGRRLLDFGCGAGGFLVEARAAGFEVMGLELNKDLAQMVSTDLGIPVFQGLIDDQRLAQDRFNIILSAQVFEHLLDPRQTLIDLKRLLEPPGFVLIEVPNQQALRETLRRGRTLDDSHLFYFNARALTWLLEDLGFEIVAVEEGLRPYRFSRTLGKMPRLVMSSLIRLFSAFQIKTGLSVLARLR